MNRDVGPVFWALADGTRRQVLLRLAGGRTATATELAAELPITRQAVSKHLAALSDAGLVDVRRLGREVRYSLSPEPLFAATSWIEDLNDQWRGRLESLRTYLTSPAEES